MSRPFEPDWVVCPGETLREWLDEAHLPPTFLVFVHGIEAETVARLLAGEEPLTEQLADELAVATRVPARVWLALERNYRTGLAKGLTHTHPEAS